MEDRHLNAVGADEGPAYDVGSKLPLAALAWLSSRLVVALDFSENYDIATMFFSQTPRNITMPRTVTNSQF